MLVVAFYLFIFFCRKLASHFLERDEEWQQIRILTLAIKKKKKKKKKEEEIKPQGFPRDSGRSVFCLTHTQQGQIRILLGGGTE